MCKFIYRAPEHQTGWSRSRCTPSRMESAFRGHAERVRWRVSDAENSTWSDRWSDTLWTSLREPSARSRRSVEEEMMTRWRRSAVRLLMRPGRKTSAPPTTAPILLLSFLRHLEALFGNQGTSFYPVTPTKAPRSLRQPRHLTAAAHFVAEYSSTCSQDGLLECNARSFCA